MNPDDPKNWRMDGYYIGFERTGNDAIDRILSAVACAGKWAHNTSDWCDASETLPYKHLRGASPVEWIQNAANDAGKEAPKL